jgi:hypothetical protein
MMKQEQLPDGSILRWAFNIADDGYKAGLYRGDFQVFSGLLGTEQQVFAWAHGKGGEALRRAEAGVVVPAQWFEPGACVPVTPDTVALLMRALRMRNQDAERYRKLREYHVDCYIASGKGEDLDRAIDAWRKP